MNRITKKQALEAYNNPAIKVLFELYFPSFEDYWKRCQELNKMSDKDFEKERQKALEKLNQIKKVVKNN